MVKATVYEEARAKINLTLGVAPQNQDGMHPISSRMVTLDLCDNLELTRLEAHVLSNYAVLWHKDAPKTSEIDWPITSDLAVRAHKAIEQAVGRLLPVQMKLEKRIPVGGGLGGGSADAGAMVRAVVALFDLDIDCAEIALSLGSDVPFMVYGGAADVSGIGEVVMPVQCLSMHIVLAIPEYNCSTANVFSAFDRNGSEDFEGKNDLLTAACIVQPQLKKDMELLSHVTGKNGNLSGSGSTMFVICDNAEQATEVAEKIRTQTTLVALATQTSPNAIGDP
jgi:4-diphosphocytidyl-2-C-methyl-D-erythritol kinase